GSLSDGGRVAIRWFRNADRNLEIHWDESGGPTVAKPARKGFGTTIIEHSVPYDLGGVARLDYLPEGLKACFIVPERHLASARDVRGRPIADSKRELPAVEVRGDLLAGRRVLLVEDSLIIALDAEDILKRLGAREVATGGTVHEALRVIDEQRPDIAILDINLGDHDSFAVADALDFADVPFMFATGYGEQLLLPEKYRTRVVLQKPYTMASLARRLPELLGQTERTAAT
ncbi:MAG: response regulator, partial [Pseudomonadota bacterium]|nr:response regulator [Pseudomonadota bacterium]